MNEAIIIIPAYNEGSHIKSIIDTTLSLFPHMDIAVINDASKDNTPSEVLKTKAALISHPFNMGYGAAIQTGYKYAYRNNYNYLIQIDADGQHDLNSISSIYNEIKKDESDLVLGSRFLGGLNYKTPIVRRLGMILFKYIVNIITGLKLSDTTTGFQAMNRKTLALFIRDSFPIDYPDADVIIMSKKYGLKIKEIPVVMHNSKNKTSMHSSYFKSLIYIIQMLLSIGIILMQKKDKF